MQAEESVKRERAAVRSRPSQRQVAAQLGVSRIAPCRYRRQAIERAAQNHEYEARLLAVGRAGERHARAQQGTACGQRPDCQEVTSLHSTYLLMNSGEANSRAIACDALSACAIASRVAALSTLPSICGPSSIALRRGPTLCPTASAHSIRFNSPEAPS